MQIHYNSYTVFDRYPEWVAEEGRCPVRSPAHLLPFHWEKSNIVGSKYRGIGTGDYRTDTY